MRTWNKRTAGIFSVLLLAVFAITAGAALPASAAGDLPRLVDRAELLSDSEVSGSRSISWWLQSIPWKAEPRWRTRMIFMTTVVMALAIRGTEFFC